MNVEKKNIVATLFTLALTPFFVVGLVSLVPFDVTRGQGLPGVFGGQIQTTLTCDAICGVPPGIAIYVGPPGVGESNPLHPGWIRVFPGTTVYEYGQLHPGAWVLGNYRPPDTCLHFNGWHCVFIPVEGTAVIMGTSL